MIEGLVLLAISGAVGALLVNRLYLLISRGELKVQGVVYTRQSDPASYWTLLVVLIVGTILTLGVVVVSLAALLTLP